MAETGILDKLEKKFPVEDPCAEKEEEAMKAHALSIDEVAAVFVILAVGIAAALLALVAENVWIIKRKRSS